MRRGELWWADLPEPVGSEPGYRRPVLIISSDDFNRSSIKTVLAVAVTSNTRLAKGPGNVLLPAREAHLAHDSVLSVSQLLTVDKRFLDERIIALPPPLLAQLDEGLKLVLALR